MKKNRLLYISSIFCFSIVGFSAHMTDDIANISSEDEALRLIANNTNVILLCAPRSDELGQTFIEIRGGVDDYIHAKAMKLSMKWTNVTKSAPDNFDIANKPDYMSNEDFMAECSSIHKVAWKTPSGTYKLRIYTKKSMITLEGPAFESVGLADGSLLLLLERNSKEFTKKYFKVRDISTFENRASRGLYFLSLCALGLVLSFRAAEERAYPQAVHEPSL